MEYGALIGITYLSLIDPLLIILSLLAGFLTAHWYFHVLAAFFVGSLVGYIELHNFPSRESHIFSGLAIALASYAWIIIAGLIRHYTFKRALLDEFICSQRRDEIV